MIPVNTKLALLASMASAMQKLPESARDVVNQPALVRNAGRDVKAAWIPPKDRKPNTNGLNRKVRRRLAALAAHGKLVPPRPKPPAVQLLPPSPRSVAHGKL